MVYLRAERVFILEHYFASKLFAAVREAFSDAYPDKEVPNKTTIHQLVTTFRDKEVFVCDKCPFREKKKQLKLRPHLFQTVCQLQQRDKAAVIQYFHWFRRFVREGVHV
jgi:hypothetical protein